MSTKSGALRFCKSVQEEPFVSTVPKALSMSFLTAKEVTEKAKRAHQQYIKDFYENEDKSLRQIAK